MQFVLYFVQNVTTLQINSGRVFRSTFAMDEHEKKLTHIKKSK